MNNREVDHKNIVDNFYHGKYKNLEETGNGKFTWDGVSNFIAWEHNKLRVLYILKEATSDFEPSCGIKLCGKKPLELNIVRWRYALMELYDNPNQNPKFHNADFFLNGEKEKIFDDIAIVEVKKLDEGNGTSKDPIIEEYAKADRILLKRQIEILDPHIIICGGTWGSYQIIEDWKADVNNIQQSIIYVEEESGISAAIWSHRNRMVISFYHPTPIGRSPEKLFDLLCRMIQEGKAFEKFDWHKNKNVHS